jgi:hypothetical protein
MGKSSRLIIVDFPARHVLLPEGIPRKPRINLPRITWLFNVAMANHHFTVR